MLKKYLLIALCLVGNFIIPMEESNISLEEVKSRPKRTLSEIQEEELPVQKKQKLSEEGLPAEVPVIISFEDEHGQMHSLTADQSRMLQAISEVLNVGVTHTKKGLLTLGTIPLNRDEFDQFFHFIELVYQLITTREEDKNKVRQEIEVRINKLAFIEKLHLLSLSDYLMITLLEDILIQNVAKDAQNKAQLKMFKDNHQAWQAQYKDILPHQQKRIVKSLLQPYHFILLERLKVPYITIDTDSAVYSVAWSPDGDRLVSGSDDNTIHIWDSATWQSLDIANENPVESVAWSPDGTKIASGSDNGIVHIWDSANGRLLKELIGHKDSVYSLAWDPYGTKIVSGSADKTIRIWDSSTGKLLHTLEGNASLGVDSVSWSPDGTKIASGAGDETIRIWDSATGKLLKNFTVTSAAISVAWSPDGNRIASGSGNKTIDILDAVTGKLLKTLKNHMQVVTSVAWSPNGTKIVCGLWNDAIHIWDSVSGELLKVLMENETHTEPIFSVAWNPKYAKLASGALSGTIHIWDISYLLKFIDTLKQINLPQALFIISILSKEQWENNDTLLTIFNGFPDLIKDNSLFRDIVASEDH